MRPAEAVFLGCKLFVLRGRGASRPNRPFQLHFFLFEGTAGCQSAATEFVFTSVSMNYLVVFKDGIPQLTAQGMVSGAARLQ